MIQWMMTDAGKQLVKLLKESPNWKYDSYRASHMDGDKVQLWITKEIVFVELEVRVASATKVGYHGSEEIKISFIDKFVLHRLVKKAIDKVSKAYNAELVARIMNRDEPKE